MSGSETFCPKSQGAKCPSPRRLSPKSPSAKTLPAPSLHDCETSSMIVTFPEAWRSVGRQNVPSFGHL